MSGAVSWHNSWAVRVSGQERCELPSPALFAQTSAPRLGVRQTMAKRKTAMVEHLPSEVEVVPYDGAKRCRIGDLGMWNDSEVKRAVSTASCLLSLKVEVPDLAGACLSKASNCQEHLDKANFTALYGTILLPLPVPPRIEDRKAKPAMSKHSCSLPEGRPLPPAPILVSYTTKKTTSNAWLHQIH